MERSGFIVLTLVSLVTATPHGYGAKSAAVAKAEASAGAGAFGALPVIPADIPNAPGFSGSFSKSSSSSFASSSASSSSSSFSFSGTGSNIIPGLGSNALPGLGCSSGGCEGKHGLSSNTQGSNSNATPGYVFNGAAAGARAIADSHLPTNNGINDGCFGPNCNNVGQSGKKCSTGLCEPVDDKSKQESSTNPSYARSPDNKAAGIDYSTNNNNFNAGDKPEATDKDESVHGHTGSPLTNAKPNYSSATPESKLNNEKVKSPECNGPDCDLYVPYSSSSKTDQPQGINKPSTHLETPYRENECTTHDCNSSPHGSTKSNKLPSSYNVPIFSVNVHNGAKQGCDSGNCNPSDTYVNSPSYSGQRTNPPPRNQCPYGNCGIPSLPPSAQNSESNPSCVSGNCETPEYPPYAPKGIEQSINCVKGDCNSPPPLNIIPIASNPDCSFGKCSKPTFQMNVQPIVPKDQPNQYNAAANVHMNPSYNQHIPIRPESHQTFSPNAPTSPSYRPMGSPSYQPNYPSNPTIFSPNKPHSNNNFNTNPSHPYSHSRPDGNPTFNGQPQSPICTSNNCNANSAPPQNNPNLPSQFPSSFPSNSFQKPTYNNNNTPFTSSQGKPLGCTSLDCSTPINPGQESNYKYPDHSNTFGSPFNGPIKTPDSQFNTGSQVYTGGFGGPGGSLNGNGPHSEKPNGNSFSPAPGAYKPPHTAHDQPKPLATTDLTKPQASNDRYSGSFGNPPRPSTDNNLNFNPVLNVSPSSTSNDPSKDGEKPKYTGGFGGPPGLLKPNENILQPNGQTPVCASGACGGNNNNQLGASNGGAAVAKAEAVAYTGGFGGPPGLLKPYDDGKIEGKQNIGYHNGQNIGAPSETSNSVHTPNSSGSGALSGAQANAVASASAGAVGRSTGEPSGCNSGCSGQNGAKNVLGHDVATALASAKSVAGAHAPGTSVASAQAHASAGASVKGGYPWS